MNDTTMFAARTQQGRKRARNEDVYRVDAELGLFVVCDGLGGQAGGQEAAALAADAIVAEVKQRSRPLERLHAQVGVEILRDAVLAAHDRVTTEASRGTFGRMATTAVVAMVMPGAAVVASLGDSRAYHVGRRGLRRMTRDHTVAEEFVRMGLISGTEAAQHPYRNVLHRLVGGSSRCGPDIRVLRVAPGDRLLLCSDGLSGSVATAELAALASLPSLATAADALLAAGLDGSGGDDTTAILIELPATPTT